MKIPKGDQLIGAVLFAIIFCMAMVPFMAGSCHLASLAAAKLDFAPMVGVDAEPLTVTYADDPENPVVVEMPYLSKLAPGRYKVVGIEKVGE